MLTLALMAHAWFQQAVPRTETDIVAYAVRVNPGIVAQRQHVTEAQARVEEVAGAKRLQLAFVGTVSGSMGQVAQPTSNQSFTAAEGSLVAPIPNLPRASAQVEQAEAQLEAAQAQLRRAELDVEFRARQAYVEVLRSREGQTIADENLAQATRQEADTRSRITAGDVPPADVLKTQVQVAQDRAAQARARIAVSVARQDLNDLLLLDLNAPLDLSPTTPQPPLALATQDAVSLAMKRSPDVLEADANVRAAQAGVRLARHGRDADFSLQLTHSRTTDITAYSQLTTLALSINLPLLDGGAVKQQVKQAEAQLAQAVTNRKSVGRGIALAVQQAILDVQGGEANVAATGTTEDIARQSLDKARQAYAAGLTTTRDVLDAQLVYSQARIEHSSAEYDLAISRAHLSQLLGGSLP